MHPHALAKKGDNLEDIYNILQRYKYTIRLEGSLLSKEEFCKKNDLFDIQLDCEGCQES